MLPFTLTFHSAEISLFGQKYFPFCYWLITYVLPQVFGILNYIFFFFGTGCTRSADESLKVSSTRLHKYIQHLPDTTKIALTMAISSTWSISINYLVIGLLREPFSLSKRLNMSNFLFMDRFDINLVQSLISAKLGHISQNRNNAFDKSKWDQLTENLDRREN